MSSPKPVDFILLLNTFREGLIMNLVSVQEVISWADHVILNAKEPDYFFIELSLNSNKNQLIEIIGQQTIEIDSEIYPRVLFGILYRKLINDESSLTVENTARVLGTWLNFKSLTNFEFNRLYTFDDFELFYLPDVTQLQVELIEFLSVYDAFTLDNYLEWTDINVKVEDVLRIKEAEAEVVTASIRKQWEENNKKPISENVVSAIILTAFLVFIAVMVNVYKIEWSSLWPSLLVVIVLVAKRYTMPKSN